MLIDENLGKCKDLEMESQNMWYLIKTAIPIKIHTSRTIAK